MQDQNPEFQNLLRLLESTASANVQVGLQIAQNYQSEFEAHYGYTLQDYSELVEFLLKYDAWKCDEPINQIGVLRLPKKEIEKLPDSIFLLSNLQFLNLTDNKIEELPIEIGKLSKLESLLLDNNSLTKLPNTIGNLTTLKTLSISHNDLTHLPLALKNMQDCDIYAGANSTQLLQRFVKDWGNVIFEDF